MDKHTTRLGCALCAAAFATFALNGKAHAFRLIEAQAGGGTFCAGAQVACGADTLITRWWQNPVPFWVNEDASADSSDADLPQATILSLSQNSYQAWEDVPMSIIKFAFVDETPARIAADGTNTTLWFNAGFDSSSCVGSMGAANGLLGITILTEVANTGEIVDADVVLDSADNWNTDASCAQFDAQSVLTHEYGHSIGIHHTDLGGGAVATRPTMASPYFCDAGIASGRTLENDDRSAAQCLYPENPALVLLDETGSMTTGNRMNDAKESADAFIDDLADNTMGVAAFADAACGRLGYDLLQDWTDTVASLHGAVATTSACGSTPLWESTCCALGKAVEVAPSSVLVITDTMENASNGTCSPECPAGYCGCGSNVDAYNMYDGTDVSLYVIDISDYHGTGALSQSDSATQRPAADRDGYECNQQVPNEDGRKLQALARHTGALYCAAYNEPELLQARLAIERHMARTAKKKQNPPDCKPQLAIDDVQVYEGGRPVSPYLDRSVTLSGLVTAKRQTFDLGTIYIEDCTGGIRLYDTLGPEVRLGDRVTVTGTLGNFLGEHRLASVQSLRVLGSDTQVQPALLGPKEALDFERVGQLLAVLGYAGQVANNRFAFVPKAGASPALTVAIDPDTGIDAASVRAGSQYVVTGVLSSRSGQLELLPRSPDDIIQRSVASAPIDP